MEKCASCDVFGKKKNVLWLVSGVVFYIWCLVSSVWCLVSGVWCLVSCIQCLVSGVLCLVSGDWCLDPCCTALNESLSKYIIALSTWNTAKINLQPTPLPLPMELPISLPVPLPLLLECDNIVLSVWILDRFHYIKPITANRLGSHMRLGCYLE